MSTIYEKMMEKNQEVISLEKLLEDDIHCQSSHEQDYEGDDTEVCTVIVVAKKTVACVGLSFFICQSSLEYNLEVLSYHGNRCDCGALITSCWSVMPV